MIKSTIFLLVTLLASVSTYAQNKPDNDALMKKFAQYYNTESNDSLYMLLSDNIKTRLPLSSMNTALTQIKTNLGKLEKIEYLRKEKEYHLSIGVFGRSGPVLYISADTLNKVVGFYIAPDKRIVPGSIAVKADEATLYGTLSVPTTSKPVPIVLLIAGSGPTDRDGNSQLLGGKPNYLKQLSDSLKIKNIAVFRYDKRGVGQSTTTKNISDVTFEDMADDAVAIIKVLKADNRFSKVIIAGHSEGSSVGMLALNREKADAFISLAGPGFPADQILKSQLKSKMTSGDYSKAILMIDSIKAGNYTKQKMDAPFNSLFNISLQPYLNSWMKYNPEMMISSLKMPVLIVQGTTDLQVGTDDAQALKKAKPEAQLKIISNMSHILKEGASDPQQNFATYSMPDLPLHPQLVPVLVNFINNLP